MEQVVAVATALMLNVVSCGLSLSWLLAWLGAWLVWAWLVFHFLLLLFFVFSYRAIFFSFSPQEEPANAAAQKVPERGGCDPEAGLVLVFIASACGGFSVGHSD